MGDRIKIRQCVKKGYIEMDNGGVADLSYPSSKLRRGRVQEDGWICPTLTCNHGVHQIEREGDEVGDYTYSIRKLTPGECFALMGLDKEVVERCKALGVSESSLYKQAGNGIVTNCVQYIAEHLYKAQENSGYVTTDERKNGKPVEAKKDEVVTLYSAGGNVTGHQMELEEICMNMA